MKQLKFQATIYCRQNNRPVVFRSNELIISLVDEDPKTYYRPVKATLYLPQDSKKHCHCLSLLSIISLTTFCRF